MQPPWRRILGSVLYPALVIIIVDRKRILAGEFDLLLTLPAYFLTAAMTYRAWPAVEIAWERYWRHRLGWSRNTEKEG